MDWRKKLNPGNTQWVRQCLFGNKFCFPSLQLKPTIFQMFSFLFRWKGLGPEMLNLVLFPQMLLHLLSIYNVFCFYCKWVERVDVCKLSRTSCSVLSDLRTFSTSWGKSLIVPANPRRT